MSKIKSICLDETEMPKSNPTGEHLRKRIELLSAVSLTPAGDEDVVGVVSLMNRAYRGADADEGWTTEVGLIEGNRISAATLHDEIAQKKNAKLLVWKLSDKVVGCVWVEPMDADTWYLGSLAIDPQVQNRKLGRHLLNAAEQWCKAREARSIYITVLEARDTLIAWYERRGYCKNGDTELFPYDDDRFGTPIRQGLYFAVMTKSLE